jgi:site-specific recombinase XerC
MHRWWYRCLARVGVVDQGTTRGKKMHGARYPSGTELYLATGDIHAPKRLLGHGDVSTTASQGVGRVSCGQQFRSTA